MKGTKKNKIPTLLAIAILVMGLVVGVVLVNRVQSFRLGANAPITPKDVRISNMTDESFTVSWITDKETFGFIKWGEKDKQLEKIAFGAIQNPSRIHYLTVSNLKPEKSYFFVINSDDTQFDNNGIPWQIETGPPLNKYPPSKVISGTILTKYGLPAKNALVYVNVAGSAPLSTTTGDDGTFLLPISHARTAHMDSYIQINDLTSLIEIYIQGGPLGIASAQTYPVSAKPLAPIRLGRFHNFKTINPLGGMEIPEAQVVIPQ